MQQLPFDVRAQLFSGPPPTADPELVELARKHLAKHELLGKTSDTTPPISVKLPQLQGKTLDEHFYRLGLDAAEPFREYAETFSKLELPAQPKEWVAQSGWTRYDVRTGEAMKVDFPDPEDKMLVFDVEVLYKISPYAVMACAASPDTWYAWLSPWLLGETESDKHLIPLGDPTTPRVIVGHNIGYDRARMLEEYNIKQTKNSFLDTMSLHVAVNGMCSQQRPTWMKHAKNRELRQKFTGDSQSASLIGILESGAGDEEEEAWVGRSSINSLRDVAKFHCNIDMDKTVRDEFGTLDREGVVGRLNVLLDYCATDVAITHKVYKEIFPRFLEVCPHPVSFAALRHLSSVMLPVNDTWDEYIKNAENKYQELLEAVGKNLRQLAEEARMLKQDPSVHEDEWFRQLDWSDQEIRMTKETKKNPSRIAANQKMPGEPKWYKDLFPKANGPMNLTVRTRIAPLLLKMSWDKKPLIWSDLHGWTFRVTPDEASAYDGTPAVKVSMLDEKNPALQDDTGYVYFKIPHKDGPQARCANPLAKGYLQYFDKEVLSSQYPLALEALTMNAQCSYWISARERIRTQMVVYGDDKNKNLGLDASSLGSEHKLGMILPQLIPMGTITRRAVERTWLTASNAKKNRVGSELKAMVKAPPGYVFVGADVDSEELWIAALVGDAQFKIHGGGALGFMTLEGTKTAGTDLHSKTASILGISRGSAKIFNYGRIYGAGLKFASTLLRQFNPTISDTKAVETAENLYRETKGIKVKPSQALFNRSFWRGGTESLVFNKLEEFAEQDKPCTPVLGAGITEALMRGNLSRGGFLTSRINWAIQSSGVDYLHLLLISMDYLIRRYGLTARVAITVHDEIRYLVKEEDKYRVAMALQVANIWTRAIFSQQMGIEDLPQSCAWFSGVDIDHVFRKEVDLDCVTPSHPDPIAPGECVGIQELLAMGDVATLDESKPEIDLSRWSYTPRIPVMKELESKESKEKSMLQLRAQIADEKELKEIYEEWRDLQPPKTNSSSRASWDDYDDDQRPYWKGRSGQARSSFQKKMTTAVAMPQRTLVRKSAY